MVRRRLQSLVERVSPDVSDSTAVRIRIFSIIGLVVFVATLGVAGLISGLGLFLLMMIETNAIGVVGASLLLAFSATAFVSSYLWLSG